MSKKKKSSKSSSVVWRIILSFIAVAMILLSLRNISLYFIGDKTFANVTTTRRGGSNDGAVSSARYEWSVDYTFTDSNGTTHNGHTTVRGSDTSSGSISPVVYYYSFAPFLNALEMDASPNLGQLILVVLGVFLLFVMNKKKKNRADQQFE